jgi:hypothetical protein
MLYYCFHQSLRLASILNQIYPIHYISIRSILILFPIILLRLIILNIFGEEFKLWSSTLCIFLQLYIISSWRASFDCESVNLKSLVRVLWFMGRDILYPCRWMPSFQRTTLPSPSGSKWLERRPWRWKQHNIRIVNNTVYIHMVQRPKRINNTMQSF